MAMDGQSSNPKSTFHTANTFLRIVKMNTSNKPNGYWFSAGLFALISVFIPLHNALSDELIMKDGSKVIGEIIKREGGTREFKTSYTDVIKVQRNQVSETPC